MIDQELAAMDQAAEWKAAEKAERKQRFKEGSGSLGKKERKEVRADERAARKPKMPPKR